MFARPVDEMRKIGPIGLFRQLRRPRLGSRDDQSVGPAREKRVEIIMRLAQLAPRRFAARHPGRQVATKTERRLAKRR